MFKHAHISPGNSKTGYCFSFDLPARMTCPGMTEECGKYCYAANLMDIYKGVRDKYMRNLEFADSPEFIRTMIRDIPRNCEFRIHVSGDFKDAAYVLDWIAIASKRPDVTFYTYTRSWRIRKIWVAIRELAKLPNVTVNLSCDRGTGKPKVVDADKFRWAYLTNEHGTDIPFKLRRDDIVFRTTSTGRKGNHKWKRKDAIEKGLDPNVVAPLIHNIGGAPICPFERGRDLDNFSCSQCRLCINKPRGANA